MHSIPVIATIFFIGIVIDKFGTQKTAVFLALASLVGAICVATGHRHFGILILGRLLFGFGSESMSVTAQKMLSHKFKDSILSLAFGFQILWGQLGSCIVFLLMPVLNDRFGTITALWSVPIMAIFSLLTTLLYYWIDVRYEADKRIRPSPPISPDASTHEATTLSDSQDIPNPSYSSSSVSLLQRSSVRSRDGKSSKKSSSNSSSSSSPTSVLTSELEETEDFDSKTTLSRRREGGSERGENGNGSVEETGLSSPGSNSTQEGNMLAFDAITEDEQFAVPNDKFELRDLKTLPGAFWVLLTLYFSVSTTFFVWNSFGGDRLHEKFNYPHRQAGTVVALSNLAAMASPLTGYIVDRIGHRTKFIFAGVCLMLVTYCAITWTSILPTLWYVLLGLGVSLCQPIVFASVSLIVKETITGTAFALMSLALNIGQVVFPVIVGKMHERSKSYQTSNYVFVALAVLALAFALLLYFVEQHMRVLDTVGLWRGTPPASVYTELYVANLAKRDRAEGTTYVASHPNDALADGDVVPLDVENENVTAALDGSTGRPSAILHV